MSTQSEQDQRIEDVWREIMETGDYGKARSQRRIFKLMPGDPRCRICFAPFSGWGSTVARVFYDKRPSKLSPYLCNACEDFARDHQGGAEVELTMLFVDVRGSTTLAEQMTPRAFSDLINRFYTMATHSLVHWDALVDKIIGDQAAGIFVPGLAGPEHARRAISAAVEIMEQSGQWREEGPWIPLGVGVHTGIAFVGSVGGDGGTSDITVLGDAPNTAARLSSEARPGEILISEATCAAAGLADESLEVRKLALKGKEQAVTVRVVANDRVPE
jgi:adenylate cyclase